MTVIKPTSGPGVGLFFAEQDVWAWNRTAATLTPGEMVMFDLTDTDGDTTTTLTEGADGSTFANVISPSTAGIGGLAGGANHPGFFFGIVLTGGADNTKVQLRMRGIVRASLTSAAATIGVGLVGANSVRTLTATVAANNKVLGIVREANGSAAGLFSILFDGINGFGTVVAT
jgi:hypothetical protein